MKQSERSIEVIRAERLAFTYLGEQQSALQPCSFSIMRGSITLIAGRNGSGKTTLCKLLAGVMKSHEGACAGEVIYGGLCSSRGRDRRAPLIGFVLQEAKEQFIIGIVEDELAFAPENLGLPHAEIGARVERQLRRADLLHLRLRQAKQLSGGEQQRVAVASILTMEPDVLIMDDAWGQLDIPSRRGLVEQLQDWYRQGKTMVLAVSRLDEWLEEEQYGWLTEARVLLLQDGRIVADRLLPHYTMEDTANREKPVRRDRLYQPSPETQVKRVAPHIHHSREWEKVLLNVAHVSFQYQATFGQASRQPNFALQSICFQLQVGQCMVLTGLNGAGKSTLFRLIVGAMPRYAGKMVGTIEIAGQPLSKLCPHERAQLVGFVAQQPEQHFFATSVWDEMRAALYMANKCGRLHLQGYLRNAAGIPTAACIEREVERRLHQYRLWEVKHLHPYEVSTGLRRLLSLAVASAHEPTVLLLDEPTAAVDAVHAAFVRDWCLQQIANGRALIVATHDRMWDHMPHLGNHPNPSIVKAKLDAGQLNIRAIGDVHTANL